MVYFAQSNWEGNVAVRSFEEWLQIVTVDRKKKRDMEKRKEKRG